MARKFLVPIDLSKNSLLNATLHPSGTQPSSPVAGQVWFDSNSGVNALKVYNGTTWVTLADTAAAGVTSVAGTANEIEVTGGGSGPYTGAVTIGLPNDVTIGNNLTVTGNLTVNGTTTTVNSETVSIADNVLVLNSDVTGSPSSNAGVEVERGTETNASILWDETADKWKVGLAGSETEISLSGHTHTTSDVTGLQGYVKDEAMASITGGTHSGVSVSYNTSTDILTITNTGVTSVNGSTGAVTVAAASHTHSSSDITDFAEAAQDAVGNNVADTATVNLEYNDSTGAISAAVIKKTSDSYIDLTSGVAVDLSTLEPKLVTDGFTKKYSANVGNNSSTSIAITHNLGTRDVVVNVYDAATYDTIECDVVRTNTNTVTLGFTVAPATDAYRVVIIG